MQYFEYDDMGNVETNIRAVAVAGRSSYWFKTQWEYDSWNRIQQIVYPDNETVTYHYDRAGQVKKMTSDMNNFDLITDIHYDAYGQRQLLFYGNGTSISYDYDQRQRLNLLANTFSNGFITKEYSYDELSNITKIATLDDNYLIEFSGQGNLGGPMEYDYFYDNYNRLVGSTGFYIGPNDFPNEQPTLLRQQYDLEMQYDDKHNILNKNQYHRQTEVTGLSATPNPWQTHQKTSYDLLYEDYATGGHSSGDYSYVQPHAPRKITETPVDINDPLESQIKVQEIDYDADGNMTSIQQKIKDPDNPLTEKVLTLRKHRWDEEDRLRGVDLMPDNDPNRPEIASYTYDASGERVVRYVPGRLDAFYNASNTGFSDRLESFVYPSGLLTAKTLKGMNINKQIMTYTKHYYIGSERISSVIGTGNSVGYNICISDFPSSSDLAEMNQKVTQAAQALQDDYDYFEKHLSLSQAFAIRPSCGVSSTGTETPYWFHPDHLGSSSYISNLNGEISQHLEYLPFGETLVEEHKNSNNSPYKFNAKELDDETGNYYYGARYLNPKWSFWLSVDPLAEKYPGWSPYNYTLLNPVKLIDPDGRSVDWKPTKNGDLIAEAGDNAQTLANYLNITPKQAQSMLRKQGFRNIKDQLVHGNDEVMSGQTVTVDNNMTRSIKNSKGKTPTGVGVNNPITPSTDNYICDQASQMAVDGIEINPTNAKGYNQFLPGLFTEGYSEVESFDNVALGKGIAIIGGQHVVTNYGKSENGTQYVYSKDGRFFKPQIRSLDETIDLYNDNQGTNFTRDDVKFYKKD